MSSEQVCNSNRRDIVPGGLDEQNKTIILNGYLVLHKSATRLPEVRCKKRRLQLMKIALLSDACNCKNRYRY